MKVSKISGILYIVGSLLVFGSWVNLVPTGLGWIGWLMALIGWGLSNASNTSRERVVLPVSRADEIEKLDILRKEGVVTEEEFQLEKIRILKKL
jgi:hypothetical protein